jgi:gliding motility-associated-like protein
MEGLPCPRTPIQFTDLSEATYPPVVSWDWNFGDGTRAAEPNPVHSYTSGGSYRVQLISTSVKGCKDTAVKTRDVEFFRPFAGNDTVIVKNEHIDFNATGGIRYVWTPADAFNSAIIPTPRSFFPDTGLFVYSVHVTSAGGCEGDDSVRILVVPDPYVFMPTAFTPNQDGLNDFLHPLSAGYSDIRYFRIFNRWGQVVYQTDNFDKGWDGTLNGQLAEIGTYFWVLGIKDRFGKEQMLRGNVTLIR